MSASPRTTTATGPYVHAIWGGTDANARLRGKLTSVTDPEFRCYELDLTNTASQTSTATVSAGSVVGFKADNSMVRQTRSAARAHAHVSPHRATQATLMR
jgi:hypothetical protein